MYLVLLLSALEHTDGGLSSFRLPCNLFGIIRIVDNGNVTTQSVFGGRIIVGSHFELYIFGLLSNGTVEKMTVSNCYIYWACFFEGYDKQ